MKTSITILVLFTFLNTFSQKKGFSGGLYVGAVTSQVDGDNHAGYSKFGVNFGIFSQYNLTKTLNARLELGYINKGSKFTDAKTATCYTLIVNYIEIPIYITYKPLHIKKITQLSFDLGLAPSILIKAKEDATCSKPIEPYIDVKKVDLNLLAGINWSVNKKINIGVRFLYSIIPIRKIKGNPNNDIFNRGQYNNAIVLNLFFTL